MKKIVTNQSSFQKHVKKALGELSDIVGKTLGPGGLPILLGRYGLAPDGTELKPLFTKDGVTVARNFMFSNPVLNDIVKSSIEAAEKTNKEAGDGTTTAIVLANAIYREGLKYIIAGENPVHINEKITEAVALIIQELNKLAIPVDSYDQVKSVAAISANNDDVIGEIIATAIKEVGDEGVIAIEEGYDTKTKLRVENGFQIDRGIMSNVSPDIFYTDVQRGECVLNSCAIIVYDGDIDNINDLVPIIDKITEGYTKSNPFLIIARNVSGSALNALTLNRFEQRLTNFAMIKGPHVGYIRSQWMQDIAIATGAKLITADENNQTSFLKSITLEDLGYAKKVVVTKHKTVIYEVGGDEKEIIQRVEDLKGLKTKAESPYDKAIIDSRIAALTGGVAIIEVGGSTEFEMKEIKDRIEDALNAARAATQEGVIPGGGTAFLFIKETVCRQRKFRDHLGFRIMSKVLEIPASQIITNIGLKPDVYVSDVIKTQKRKGYHWGFDGKERKIKNLIEAKIIDPLRVTRTALEKANSIANGLLICGGSIAIQHDEKDLISENNAINNVLDNSSED